MTSPLRSRTNKSTSRAQKAGRTDDEVRAIIDRNYDPTGGFIKRIELLESERAEYVAAYDDGFRAEMKAVR